MDARTAARQLQEIATLLELQGEPKPALTRWTDAARRLLRRADASLGALAESGAFDALASEPRRVLAELEQDGTSTLLEQLRESTPEGFFEMLRVPGLGVSRIRRLHDGLGVESIHELDAALRDGRLRALPRFGEKVIAQLERGLALMREQGTPVLLPHARAETERMRAAIVGDPRVLAVEVAGEVRRACEVVGEIALVVAVRDAADAVAVAAQIAHAAEVTSAFGVGTGRVSIRYRDGSRLRLTVVGTESFVAARWFETGSDAHVAAVVARAAARGVQITPGGARGADGRTIALASEAAIYSAAGLRDFPPELREGGDEFALDRTDDLVTLGDLRGVLHCHSQYSDGGATIAELAAAAAARGWEYLGVSDHSQSAFYAGGLTPDSLRRQHDEIDAVNASGLGVRVLKGVEADILPCGRVDYPVAVLDQFDYVIASVHSRFGMGEAQMTTRVLKAMDDPHVTILGHPTGRLLLTREPYALDVDAVLAKGAEVGVAVELNADPHRLDLDWRALHTARRLGTAIEIGPDAHDVAGLDNAALGIAMARKGGLRAADVLNTRSADDIVHAARARRSPVPA
ncbi:MAG: PHP domain-containing protein [Gemmatimonadaceae bacterium]|nr:PHP domain-containing protein [Gemmatimonadaceae bacterium]